MLNLLGSGHSTLDLLGCTIHKRVDKKDLYDFDTAKAITDVRLVRACKADTSTSSSRQAAMGL